MKKHLLALAALATVSGIAAAQSVTMYGVLDTNVSIDNKGDTTSLGAGGLTPNIIGFKGAEDLGGGMKATFNLESHFAPQNGQLGLQGVSGTGGSLGTLNKLNSNLFSRQANVGLSNSLGSISLGNQYSASVLAFASTDPRGLRESYSGLSFWLVPAALTSSATQTTSKANHIGGVFMNNSVQVNTKIAGINLGASTIIGGVAGHDDQGRAYDVGATTNVSGLDLSASYFAANQSDKSFKDVKMVAFGAAYKFGDLRLALNQLNVKDYTYNTGALGKEFLTTGFGGSYQISPALAANAAYYKSKNKVTSTQKSDNYVVGLEYSLSKRTTTYVQNAWSDNDGAVVTGSFGGTASTTNNVTQVGLRHTF